MDTSLTTILQYCGVFAFIVALCFLNIPKKIHFPMYLLVMLTPLLITPFILSGAISTEITEPVVTFLQNNGIGDSNKWVHPKLKYGSTLASVYALSVMGSIILICLGLVAKDPGFEKHHFQDDGFSTPRMIFAACFVVALFVLVNLVFYYLVRVDELVIGNIADFNPGRYSFARPLNNAVGVITVHYMTLIPSSYIGKYIRGLVRIREAMNREITI